MNRNISVSELNMRIRKLQEMMAKAGFDAILVSTNANLYYLSGGVFSGYVYIPASGNSIQFVRRPVNKTGEGIVHIRKPEQILEYLQAEGLPLPQRLALELDTMSFSDAKRCQKAFGVDTVDNASPLLAQARSVKSDFEIGLLRESGVRHCSSYRRISGLYHEGMTDVELQIEIERILRLDGCIGLFRINGPSMEIFMGNILAGDNADNPSPYDFAMGGEGLDPSLPVGCNASIIRPGNTVMIDMNGNFTGYMTDMTRSFFVGTLDEHAAKAHQLSIDIHNALRSFIKPGVEAKAAYNLAMEMVEKEGEQDYFMGHTQKAGFIGHGVGIEVNEWPVLAPRSKHVFEKGNVIAIEPKFVIPGVGAVGIENTYVVTDNGLDCLTPMPEEISELL